MNPEIFNKFMRETKLEVTGTRYAPFWHKIVAGNAVADIFLMEVVKFDVLFVCCRRCVTHYQ